tara:strand:- start:143 stop:1462 length:1320 start_codon:yes stop_codon:yes gene_type:complete
MTIPMIAGMFSLMAFNLTDTWFVSMLGTDELAAMGFTFPVVMIIGSIAMGLGQGASSVISRTVGSGDISQVRRLAIGAILLSVLTVSFFALLGIMIVDPVFRTLGAKGHILELVKQYMIPWFACVGVIFIPMTCNNILRATGDTTAPGVIMSVCAIFNVILDPILIFGWFGLPAMGLKGAAYATILSRLITLFGSFYVLYFRARLLELEIPKLSDLINSWLQILRIALPTAGAMLLMPITTGVITRLVAAHGEAAVAAVGAGDRVIRFTFLVPIALGTVMMPYVGQNWGAKKFDRIRKGWNGGLMFSSAYGLITFLLMLVLADPVARIFSNKPDVIEVMVDYLRIMLLCGCFVHASAYSSFAFNASGMPGTAWLINIVRMLLLTIPGAFIGGYFFGLNGIFWGGGLSGAGAGIISWILYNRTLTKQEELLDAESLSDQL